jgi:hypothetical protein
MQVVAFAQQLLTHGGYYDEHLEFIRIERVQVIVFDCRRCLLKVWSACHPFGYLSTREETKPQASASAI